MPASEAMYFHRAPLAHVVEYERRQKERRIEAKKREHCRRTNDRRRWA
jgi:hypothetical protein